MNYNFSEKTFPSSDGIHTIYAEIYTPKTASARGVIQLAHGMIDYVGRYKDMADYLAKEGYILAGNHHLGHGKSVKNEDEFGYFAKCGGVDYVIEDMHRMNKQLREMFPTLPIIIFGHSMGSFLARTYLIRYPGKISGCVLCGTGHMNALIVAGGKWIADGEIKKLGKTAYSEKADQLAFGAYNKRFAPNRTHFDWISLHEANVDAYIKDPLCGGKTTLGLFRDMMEGLGFICDQANIAKMDQNMPVFFIAGDQDPVGDMGQGVERAYAAFKKAGIRDVSLKLYHGLRHEILNEKTNQYVFLDVLHWLDTHC